MDEKFAFEIDFHPVGNGSKSGDAITIRYGRLNSYFNFSQKVIVIDGGTLESGKSIVEHIKNVYNTETVDLVINSHPDNDHCSGLREVMNNLTVKELWVHTPWHFSKDFIDFFKDGRITTNSLSVRLKEGLNIAHELEAIAKSKKITVKQPFSGLTFDNGIIQVLGPSYTYYSTLLANFRSTPEPVLESAISKAFSTVKEAVKWIAENMNWETLDESGETSAENNSSTILLFNYDNEKVLFTGDVGVPALKEAINYGINNGISFKDLSIFQVPHHGSRRNISPSVLNMIYSSTAYISCTANGEPKHPSKKVTNALIRRKMTPYSTKGNILCRNHNAKERQGYSTAIKIPFYNQVEE